MSEGTIGTTAKTKKDTILSIYKSGIKDIETIAGLAGAKPSYVGSVLRLEGLIDNYFDLYTSTGQPMNAYSKHFQGRLGFKDVETATRGVLVLDAGYRHYEAKQDRAGQHHTLEMGLMMLDRARWTGKLEEAEVYRQWLMQRISTPLTDPARPSVVQVEPRLVVETETVEEDPFKIAA